MFNQMTLVFEFLFMHFPLKFRLMRDNMRKFRLMRDNMRTNK